MSNRSEFNQIIDAGFTEDDRISMAASDPRIVAFIEWQVLRKTGLLNRQEILRINENPADYLDKELQELAIDYGLGSDGEDSEIIMIEAYRQVSQTEKTNG
jgi:hypothetical protein